MDQTKFIKFLSLARSHILSEEEEKWLPNGTKIVGEFTQGNLSYTDSYNGFENFSGKEVLIHNGKPVWSRFYKGGVTNKDLTKAEIEEIFAFLKKALAKFPNSNPQNRGPNRYEKGLFEYESECEGSFEKFKGREEIYWKGKKVYELNYYS
jgi:hypothetical protein